MRFLAALVLCLLGVPAAGAGQVVSADGVEISFEVAGEGDPVLVFVHGWSCDRSYWREQFDRFAEDYRVVAIDLAGHGESGTGRTDWTIESFAADVVGVMDELELGEVVLVGHSMGGPVVVEAALARPEQVVRVIGVDTLQDPDAPGMTEEQIDGMVAGFEQDFSGSMHALVSARMFVEESDPELKAWITEDMAAGDPAAGVGSLRGNLQWHSTRRAAAIEALDVPLVLINSPLFPTDLEACAAYDIEVGILLRTGHFLMMEDHERFNALLSTAAAGSPIDARRLGTASSTSSPLPEAFDSMKIRYLEIVTPDVDDVCATYTAATGVEFGSPVAELGNARTAAMPDGGMVGVRAPMHDAEVPVVRPYLHVKDIQSAWEAALAAGAEVLHPPLEIPGQGTFAIYMLGGAQHALWQD